MASNQGKGVIISEAGCAKLAERRLDDADLLVIYIDDMVFADHCVITLLGVDAAYRISTETE